MLHVHDASRAVGVVSNLMNPDGRRGFAEENKREQEKARTKYLGRQTQVPLVTLEEARHIAAYLYSLETSSVR